MSIMKLFVISTLVAAVGCKLNPAGTVIESSLKGVLFINEFMTSNGSTIADENGDYDDWIELYNSADTNIQLGGTYLTDNFNQPAKWMIPDTIIPAGGFLLFWADNEETQGPLHTNFKLNKSGEEIGLYDTEANEILLIDTISFNVQKRDTSYGRYPDGKNNWQFFPTPTPEKANQTP